MHKVLFLYLDAFEFTGGIQKFNRSFLKALHELSVDGKIDADAWGSYDSNADEKYFPSLRLKSFKANRIWFSIYTILFARKYQTVILGHLNLSILGNILKWLKPSINIVLITHGYEVWSPQKGSKQKIFQTANIILAVSRYTKQRILEHQPQLNPHKIAVFHNTIDPYFIPPNEMRRPNYLMNRYEVKPDQPIVLTITRLSSSEKYKGYDKVIANFGDVLKAFPNALYLIAGKADQSEQKRVEALIAEKQLQNAVKLVGYIPDDELIDHYLLADVFIMPSKKEGFGIVFIEAMTCGLKVIAGNKDGSPDALQDGELGTLIDPDDEKQIVEALIKSLQSNLPLSKELLQQKVFEKFRFENFKTKLYQIIDQLELSDE